MSYKEPSRAKVPRGARHRTALVTGAASGVGEECARYLHHHGATVHAVDIDKDGLALLTERLRGPRLVTHACDLTDVGALNDLPREVDILVNCAGILRLVPAEDYDDHLFNQITRLMVEAPFLLSRNVLSHMKARGWGRLIHISSTMGHRAQPFKAAYVTAKHGLEGMSKVLAAEGATYGVTSNTLALSHVLTPLLARQIADEAPLTGRDEPTYLREVLLAPLAIKELLPVSAVGPLLDLLVGSASPYITGTSLTMDCGWTGVGPQASA